MVHHLKLLCVTCSALLAQAESQRKPNFIFFFPDTIRAESLSGYGNPLDVSPNLEALAKQGTRFEQVHAMHTQCSPSRATMLTGRYMHVDGHRTQINLVQPYEENYFRLLKEAGYHVEFVGKNDVFSPATFNLSVSNWANKIGYSSGENAYEFGDAGYYSMLSTGSQQSGKHGGDYAAVAHGIDFLNSNPPEPFVLFLPIRGAHPPYGAPLDFKDKFSLDEVKGNIKLRPRNIAGKPHYHRNEAGIPFYRNLTTLHDDTFYEIQRSYLSMIAYTDWLFGELMGGLDRSGLSSRSAVFASSDHGDFGGDFGLIEKWPGGADDVLTRVPLYARIPGGAAGHVSKAPAQLADILETMLDMAGVSSQNIRFAKSLLPVLQGGEGDMQRFVYSEGGFGYRSEVFPMGSDHVKNDPRSAYYPRALEEMCLPHPPTSDLVQMEADPLWCEPGHGSPRWVMMRNLTSKLVFRTAPGISELYDLSKDPLELTNVFGNDSYSGLQSEMMLLLTSWLVETSDVPPLREDPRGMPPDHLPLTDDTCSELLQPDPSRPKPPISAQAKQKAESDTQYV
eukprot:TRINITY_DN109263_c0_g1_i1.p1 TRINITY_DN109263_c0_g1~~TRINITY_DN109263_c0_g1_i1.p1  ORF type:complete len:564 (-),score=90.81 TRINITY_DN109263_c0_g1_i1:30-1721(-)